MSELKVRITFLNPFRVVPWNEKGNRKADRKYLRGGTFARWHKKEGSSGRPYITGTLVRSALIAQLEKTLALGDLNPFNCCSGKDKTEGNIRRPAFLRRRPQHRLAEPCDRDTPCPLCRIKGTHDTHRRWEKLELDALSGWTVHFSNFRESTGAEFDWNQIVSERITNRVDFSAGKAKDYFRIYEIDPGACRQFDGTITLKIGADAPDKVEMLIATGLARVNVLAGTVCRADILPAETHAELIGKYIESCRHAPVKIDGASPKPQPQSAKAASFDFSETAERMAALFPETEREQKLRRLADAIRTLRAHDDAGCLEKLPAGKPDGRPSVWDHTPSQNMASIRDILRETAKNIGEGQWRKFCEALGQAVYLRSKGGKIDISPRLLGETEYYGRPPADDAEIGYVPQERAKRKAAWIVSGELRALTPFYFGKETRGEQTSKAILLGSDGSFRIPSTVIRGALRRDLRHIIGDGCNVALGTNPCQCAVCRIMRRTIAEDAVSSVRDAPEIRHNIRLDPNTRVVEEGALFDTETGFQGTVFPFRLHMETDGNFDAGVRAVLDHWMKGMAFFGGETGTGFGRFRLENAEACEYDLSDPKMLHAYLTNRGLRGLSGDAVREAGKRAGKQAGKQAGANLESWVACDTDVDETGMFPLPWTEVRYCVEAVSPLISRDPIAAMLREGNPDAVMIRKTVFISENQSEHRYFIKSETVRGLLRSIVADQNGLRDLDHEDCDCLLCALFGSVHRQGKLRFEDLEICGDMTEKRMDHVAIDRFTGGGVDRLKFDDWPLVGSPEKPIVLKGSFWTHQDLDDAAVAAFRKALAEFNSGSAVLGGLGAIGYGWVPEYGLVIESPNWMKALPETEWKDIPQSDGNGKEPPAPFGEPAEIRLKPASEGTHYHPHYFLEPLKSEVSREPDPVSHADRQDELFTGTIQCKLTTEGPVFIPDSDQGNDDYFGMKAEHPEHKNLGFFRIDEKPAIPGSSIRGMVSSVYEALTHSCFRIMDEKMKLSWRMPADGNLTQEFNPGRILKTGGGWEIEEMESEQRTSKKGKTTRIPIRVPLYDSGGFLRDSRLRGKNITAASQKMGEKGPKLRNFILRKELDTIHRERFHPSYSYPHFMDYLADSLEGGKRAAYLKITGPNKVEKIEIGGENSVGPKTKNLPQDWTKTEHTDFRSADKVNPRTRKKYTKVIPYFEATDGKFIYRMSKRCERVFLEKRHKTFVRIPKSTAERYRQVLKEYKENLDRNDIPAVFRTRLPKDLNNGDLVYYRKEKDMVTDIIPVCISRIVDRRPIAARLPHESLRKCAFECVENCDECPELCKKVADYFSPHPKGLCPACHLFGTTSYKSRIAFGMAWPESEKANWHLPDENESKGGALTLPLLERPRPSWSIPFEENEKLKVPGRKFYVHHPWSVDAIAGENRVKPNENNRTVEPLGKGNSFNFEVRFHNLRKWELGLLLYALELGPGMAHKLGMGKALGLGSVTIGVDSVSVKKPLPDIGKNELVALGLSHLSDVILKDAPEEEKAGYYNRLRDLMTLPQGTGNPIVRYPDLERKSETDPPGYTNFTKKQDPKTQKPNPFYMKPAERLSILQTPWKPWHPRSEKSRAR